MEQLALAMSTKAKKATVMVSVILSGKTINRRVPQWVFERGSSFVRGWVKVGESK